MQRLISVLFLLPFFASAQIGWVNLEFQTDGYGGESTWEIYMVGSDSVYAAGGPYPNNSYNQQLVTIPAGEYNLVVSDEFGDGRGGLVLKTPVAQAHTFTILLRLKSRFLLTSCPVLPQFTAAWTQRQTTMTHKRTSTATTVYMTLRSGWILMDRIRLR